MKTRFFLILIFVFSLTGKIFSQDLDFKEVKSASDVINNFVTTVGGADKIKKIKSETVKGKFAVEDFEGTFFGYRSDSINFATAEGTMEGKDMLLMKSFTTRDSSWEFQVGGMREFTGDDLKKKVEDLLTGGLKFYLNYAKDGYSAALKGSDSVRGIPCYVVSFSKSGNELKTNYFDKKTFYILKSEKPNGSILEYDDFRKVKGIMKPFKIIQYAHAVVTQEIIEYKFNEPLDVSLIKKPGN